ncbi:MAG: exodeoxyribonuclease VII large subunit [Clostridium sp.]|nr:exodeoxyribonuclease VII large subunit [Clostridium sp.]
MKIKVLSVSEVNNYLKRVVDNDFILNNLSVKGEISNLTYHSSGHIYFSIKDNSGKLSCIMFRSQAEKLTFVLEEGAEVVISGRLSVYTQSGSVQLYCNSIERAGIGKLYIEFEKLKEKLGKKGYFDEKHKKPIPKFVKRIGVVTSETGAVFRDIINVTRRRNSMVDIVLYPAKVQGENAYKEVIEGINYFNSQKTVDVIIIGRGGGSLEELWNFNEEELAECIYKSKLPIVSAVGHEVDFTISDFVSDLRAATPSQAAELVVPVEADIFERLDNTYLALNKMIMDLINREKEQLDKFERILKLNSPIVKISNSYLQIDNYKQKLDKLINSKLDIEKEKLVGLNNLLTAYNPINMLSKGYAIIESDSNDRINSAKQLEEECDLKVTFKDGTVNGRFKPIS